MSSPSRDDDLRVLLRSPALTLEPRATLPDDVRRQARHHRLRVRAGGSGAAAVLVAVGVLLGPGLASSVDDLRSRTSQANAFKPDPRFPQATSAVLTMREINGANLLTWFEGSRWCTSTTRHTNQNTCLGPVAAAHRGFSWVLPAGSPSLTVDNQHVVAGIVPPDASRVVVHMKDGREFEGVFVDDSRFPRPVWSTLIDDSHGTVAYYAAFDPTGKEIARKPA
jgi:hypothetical protein